MKTIAIILISLIGLSAHAEATKELISDSANASGRHVIHLVGGQAERFINCSHRDIDFEPRTIFDYTQVDLNVSGISVPNLMLRGHRPLMQRAYNPALCEEVADYIEDSPLEIEVSFKTFIVTSESGHKSLQEELTIDFPFGKMHSKATKVLFQK